VVLADRNLETAGQVAERIERNGGGPRVAMPVDVTYRREVINLVARRD